jgi:hypothetical protein
MTGEGSHHIMLTKEIDGVTQLVTRVSHSAKVIDDGLGSLMGKQLALQLREFWDLVDCPLSEKDWEEIVAERCPDGRNPFIFG